LLQVKKAVDKANGYVFAGNESQDIQTLLACAVEAKNDIDIMSLIE
jgi:hypothetical protein